MTRKELADFLGYATIAEVSSAVTKAKAVMPSIANKRHDPYSEVSFSLDEIECIARNIIPPLNELQIELVKDNYIEHKLTYTRKKSLYIDGTESFIERYKNPSLRKKIKCCACCAYLCGKSRLSQSFNRLPFCTFYNKFVFSMTIKKRNKMCSPNIFIDSCETFERTTGDIILFERSKTH